MQMLGDVPEHYLAEVFRILKINETEVFKKYCLRHSGRLLYKDFILSMFGADRMVVEALYRRIEGVLFVGGCAPGLGIAFNLVDACFCFLLQNWLGLVVAILSCFPIPGFKAAGKGLEKFLTAMIKKIPVDKLVNSFTKVLGKRITLLRNFVDNNPYVTIQKAVREYVSELNNPFTQEVVTQLSKIITMFGPRLEEKTISNSVRMTAQPKLLELLMSTSGRIL